LYCALQLALFIFCPFTRTSLRPVDARIQEIISSILALLLRSTRNERGSCTPILATVRQLVVLAARRKALNRKGRQYDFTDCGEEPGV
jgi:hypothetical protein